MRGLDCQKRQKKGVIRRIEALTSIADPSILCVRYGPYTASGRGGDPTPSARKGNKKDSDIMAKKARKKATKKKATKKKGRKKKSGDLIISKSRTKKASGINVSGDFYAALDEAVRSMIATAEDRAVSNNRRTLRPHDL